MQTPAGANAPSNGAAVRAAAWQRIRDEFRRIASGPPVSVVAVIADDGADALAFVRELSERPNRAHWQGTLIRPIDDRADEYETVPARERLFGFGEPDAWEDFRTAAMRAGTLAKTAPESMLSASVRDRVSDFDRWVWGLFEIGWRGSDAIPFRAARCVRDAAGGAIQVDLARATGLYGGWFYSDIGDAPSASVDVVDALAILETGRALDASSGAPSDATRDTSASYGPFTQNEKTIVIHVHQQGGTLVTAVGIADGLLNDNTRGVRLSEKTVTEIVAALIKRGVLHRPLGERRGVELTPAFTASDDFRRLIAG